MPELLKSIKDPKLIKLLNEGAVGVIPTDTVYGLVCRAADQASVARLYGLKNRIKKLGTLIAADIPQLVELGMKQRYLKAIEQIWPGAVSVVIPFSDPAGSYLRQGKMDIAVRLPADKAVVQLLSKTGPLLTTSANLPDQPPAATIQSAREYFKDTVDFYVDGGDLSNRQPSTIIRVVDDAIEILRQGAVKIENNGVVI
jgi:L-threonylcarbamoyladenylate synthase